MQLWAPRLETASLEANREEKLKLLGPLTAELQRELCRVTLCVFHGVVLKGGIRKTHQNP